MLAVLCTVGAPLACSVPPSDPPGGGAPVAVTILHTADLHSHLFAERLVVSRQDARFGLGAEGETVSVGGAARLSARITAERAATERVFYLDSGDLLEGTAVYTLFHGQAEVEVLNALGVDAQAAGNHDLGRGAESLLRLRQGAARFPLVAANLEEGAPAGLFQRDALVERGGVVTAVIGLGRSPDAAPDLVHAAGVVLEAVARWRARADIVVVLSHLGRDLDEALVPRITGVDLVLGGHTHDVLDPPAVVLDCDEATSAELGCEPHPVLVVHSGAYGRYLGRVNVVVSRVQDGVTRAAHGTVVESRFTLLPVRDGTAEDPSMHALLEPYRRALVDAGLENPFAFVPAAVSRSAPRGGDSALGNFVARALRAAGAAEAAIVNTTGIRADLPQGVVTLDDVFRVVPFEDEVVVVPLTGASLLRVLREVAAASCRRSRQSQVQVDGFTVVFGCGTDGVSSLEVGGQAVAADRVYRVATTSFLVESGRWLAAGAAGAVRPGRTLREAVIDSVRPLPPCPGAPALPCLEIGGGARVDGRIRWAD